MWKKLLYIVVTVFLATILEVTLIYIGKRKGDVGFKLVLKPDFDMFS